jgi:hypothetical protein
MITNSTTAQAVSNAAEQLIQELSLSLERSRDADTSADFERLKQAIGSVVGTLEVDLLWPLYKQHPHLEPESLKYRDIP